MRILVLGAGQGGTCLLVEVLRGLDLVTFSYPYIEDKEFFHHKPFRKNYGTKLTTDALEKLTVENFFNVLKVLANFMKEHKDLFVVFSIRHPLDIFMAQIVRGQPRDKGGDTKKLSDSGTIWGSLLAIMHFFNIYQTITATYPDRCYTVRMENLVLTPRVEVDSIAQYFNVKPTQRAYEFYKYNRNAYQKNRYKNRLDPSVVGIHHQWETWANGYFKDKPNYIILATQFLSGIIKGLDYILWESKVTLQEKE
jgi:hypothetical protein